MKRLNLPNEDEAKLVAAAEVICKVLMDRAQKLAESTERKIGSCIMTLMRPYVWAYLEPEIRALRFDNRERFWEVAIYFWDIATDQSSAELIGKSSIEEVRGMNKISELIRSFVADIHKPDGLTCDHFPEFDPVRMAKRLGGMRPAISRGDGKATLRIYYKVSEDKRYLCQVDIKRTDRAS